LCGRIAPTASVLAAARLFDELERLYATPQPRAYHSLTHVSDCLRVFDGVSGLAINGDGVEWALWLHDCVYDATRKDNEVRSAEESSRMLWALGVPAAFAYGAEGAIMATRHTGEPLEGDVALVADIDMSILASDLGAYRRYAAAVRTEYSFVPEADFRKGRAAFLEGLLGRAAIYHRAELREKFEAAARRNIAAEIADLKS
jgi:predicted metal-dependent HD superfamily phosphohydrolase